MKRFTPRIEVWTWGPALVLAGLAVLALQITQPHVRVGLGMVLFGLGAVWATVYPRWAETHRRTMAAFTEAARQRKIREDALVARSRETTRRVIEKCDELEATTADLEAHIERARAA